MFTYPCHICCHLQQARFFFFLISRANNQAKHMGQLENGTNAFRCEHNGGNNTKVWTLLYTIINVLSSCINDEDDVFTNVIPKGTAQLGILAKRKCCLQHYKQKKKDGWSKYNNFLELATTNGLLGYLLHCLCAA